MSLAKIGLDKPVPNALEIASFAANCLARKVFFFDSFKSLNILSSASDKIL